MSRRESPASQRDRSASLTWRIPTRRDKTTNRDNVSNVNDADRNSGHNTNDITRNLDNAIYSSLTNLANTTSTPNISVSQNDSDISMVDVGATTPKTNDATTPKTNYSTTPKTNNEATTPRLIMLPSPRLTIAPPPRPLI
ncbi:45299_t:CDS:2, partial [Gigaspora margarita]